MAGRPRRPHWSSVDLAATYTNSFVIAANKLEGFSG